MKKEFTTLLLTGSVLVNGLLLVNSFVHEDLSKEQSKQLETALEMVEEKQNDIQELNVVIDVLNSKINGLESELKGFKQEEYNSLGVFKTTAYCPCFECSEGYGNMTAIGTQAKENRTIAVDPNVIEYGTTLLINGNEYIAEDCGGAVKGNHIDIYFDDHEEATTYGVQYVEVVKID